MKTTSQTPKTTLFETTPFFFIGAVLSLVPTISRLFFGASPHYFLLGLGSFIAAMAIPKPSKGASALAISLIILYFFPIYPLLIVTTVLLGVMVDPPRNRLSFLYISVAFLLSSIHFSIGLAFVALYSFALFSLPKYKQFQFGTPSSFVYGIIVATTTAIPFLILRTSFFLRIETWTIYFVGILVSMTAASFFRIPIVIQRGSLLLPTVSFFAIGPLIVQLNQADRPFLYEVLLLVFIALCHGMMIACTLPSKSKNSWLGIGTGLILAAILPYGWGFSIGACFFIALLFSSETNTKVIAVTSLACFLFGGLSSRGPDAPLHVQSLFRSRENQVLSYDPPIWNAKGTYSITPEATAPKYFDDDNPSRIEVEGIFTLLNDRRASAERYSGLIARALHPSPEKMLVFGDHVANTFTLIQNHLPDETICTTPLPTFTQEIASTNPTRKNIFLSPEIQLLPFHPQEIIWQESNVDIIIDILHSPVGNAINQPNDYLRTSQIESILSENGIYAQLIHLRDFPQGVPQQQTAYITKFFPYMQLWLPPQGADSLLIVASKQPFVWDRFSDFMQKQSYDVLEVGSLAISNLESSKRWVEKRTLSSEYPLRPILHLASLDKHISSPEELWENPPLRLAERLDVKKRFLKILQKAGDGKVNEVFQEASALFQGATDPGVTLAPLLAPHLKDARKAIALARVEGQKSKHWEEAKKYAMTASMLSPQNPIPKGLLGEIAIGQGLPKLAKKHFQEILDKDPKNIIAIHGMARIYGLEGNEPEVEKWLNEAVAQGGQDWRNHHNLGRFYQQKGKLSIAEKNLKKALSLSPKDSVETRLVLCELYLDQKEATRALLEIERVIKINPTAKAWFLRGRAYFDLESYQDAEDDFRRATLADPQFHDARGAIGTVKIALGDLEGAAQAFRTTLRFDPSNSAAQQNLKLVEKELAKRSTPPQ